ncbi:MAG TPA: porin [Noviherbaspirillum sp.]|nr:porin [Noviherbaspirillum sp.]
MALPKTRSGCHDRSFQQDICVSIVIRSRGGLSSCKCLSFQIFSIYLRLHGQCAFKTKMIKKIIPAIFAFGATSVGYAEPSNAPSTVTIFGSVDLNLTHSKVGNRSVIGMDQGGHLIPSRVGFRGTEDLGNGLSLNFWLEAAMSPDTGDGAPDSQLFGRRSTLSLVSKTYGELRLGRDYTPTFWNLSNFSPFGTVGTGGSSNIVEGWPLGLGTAKTLSRASNSAGYFTPRNLGGFYTQLMVATDEGIDGTRYRGGRIGYESGPLHVAAAYGETPADGDDYEVAMMGGSYNFGVIKVYVNYLQHKLGSDKQNNALMGAAIPLGRGTIKTSFARSHRFKPGAIADDARQFAVGYTYTLSKRTTLYMTYSRVKNEGNAAYVVADSSAAGEPGATATGFQVGIRHDF